MGAVSAYAEYVYDTDGNLTATRQWDSQKGGMTIPLSSSNAVITTRAFESHNADYGGGNLLRETDGLGNQTTYSYGTYPYPTTIVGAYGTGVAWTRTRVYDDAYTGLLTSETDSNNSVTTNFTYDSLWRRRTVNEASMRTTTTDYDDLRRVVISTSPLDSNHDLKTANTFDWLGRTVLTRKTADDGTQPNASDTTSVIRTVNQYLYPATPDNFCERYVNPIL